MIVTVRLEGGEYDLVRLSLLILKENHPDRKAEIEKLQRKLRQLKAKRS